MFGDRLNVLGQKKIGDEKSCPLDIEDHWWKIELNSNVNEYKWQVRK